jgi:hypothetical protein
MYHVAQRLSVYTMTMRQVCRVMATAPCFLLEAGVSTVCEVLSLAGLAGCARGWQSGEVFKGDQITMISATFGDEFWSTRGVGIGMIMQAIKVSPECSGSKPRLLACDHWLCCALVLGLPRSGRAGR